MNDMASALGWILSWRSGSRGVTAGGHRKYQQATRFA